MSRDIFNYIKLLRAPSKLTLNVSRVGASTTSLGKVFQCFTTLIVKYIFLISSLNLGMNTRGSSVNNWYYNEHSKILFNNKKFVIFSEPINPR